jgi:hypothetical protein
MKNKSVILLLAALALDARGSSAALVNRFDIETFNCAGPITNHFCDPQFDVLNWSATNGHYLVMGSDSHRAEITVRGNDLAIYYNVFNEGYEKMSAAEKAASIEDYSREKFTKTGPRPQWIILNEISAGRWPTNAAYRKWAADVVSMLKNKYNYSVVLCAPFNHPAAHPEDWQAVAANAYIGIECYLSGKAIQTHGFSTNWCEAQYRVSKDKYSHLGVPLAKLFIIEHFANTEDAKDRPWGRQGVTAEEWDKAIAVRSAALHKVGFAGFMSYCWSKNRMKVSDDELIHFEQTYKAQVLP